MYHAMPRQRPTIWLAFLVTTAVSAALISGCGGSSPSGSGPGGSLPSRDQAFERSEVYINQILLATHRTPTTMFTFTEGPCNETDEEHGDVDIEYSIPGKYGATQQASELAAVESAMKQLGYGTPMRQSRDNSVYVDVGSFGILFGADSKNLAVSVQTCYATPAPTAPPGIATEQQHLTVSPAPTSTDGPPLGAPSVASILPTPGPSGSG